MGNDFYEMFVELEVLGDMLVMGIGQNCYVCNVIIDKDCCIGDNVCIYGFMVFSDDEMDIYLICDGIIVMKKGVVVLSGIWIGL